MSQRDGKITPKLSVIIPVFNAEDNLRETLHSVLSESLQEIEVICVYDGFDDKSSEILRECDSEDGRISMLSKSGINLGEAWNAGLESARGEYVHFLEAGDRILPYSYEALYNKAEKYGMDILFCASLDYEEERGIYVENSRHSFSGLSAGIFNRPVALASNSPVWKVSGDAYGAIYRRSFLMEKGIRFGELPCAGERVLYCRAITGGGQMMICRDRAAVHRINRNAEKKERQHFDCYFHSLEQIAAYLETVSLDPEEKERVLRREIDNLFACFDRFCGESKEEGAEYEEEIEFIESSTAEFVQNYDGLSANLLRTKYADWRKKRIRRREEEKENYPERKELRIYHEKCEYPKVSVVVPIYNVEDYLNEALDSLTKQTLEEIEFLCVNDGSTDGSLAILKEYADLDRRIQILDGPNGGYGKAMNRGIDAARGEYLGILEPDDFVPPGMFGELYQAAKNNQADFVKADFNRFWVDSKGSIHKIMNRLTYYKGFYNRVLCPGDEPKTFTFVMNTWSGIYCLDFIRKWNIRHNETPGASYQDNGFWFQTFCRAERALFLNIPYYMNRRDNPNSSMSNPGKLYCVTEEYAFIQRWLQSESELWEKYAPIFYCKKFNNFMVTYRRIAQNLQHEYLRHIRDEFKEPLEQGMIDEEFLGASQTRRLKEIVADPDAWYEHVHVSVIIPVYNAENYLRQTMDCILNGNDVQIEVICVDDGSSDSSLSILREYEEHDPRVHVIEQANAGAGAARNAGMDAARGEYLLFLDSDDFFESNMAGRAYDKARSEDSDIVVFRCDQFMAETETFVPNKGALRYDLLPEERPFAGSEIERDVFKAFMGWTWDKLFRADFIRRNGIRFQEQRTTNDMLFTFSAIVKADRISTMNNTFAHRRIYEGSLSTTREKSWHCFYDALCALRARLKEWGLYGRREQDFINYSLHFSLWNLNTLKGEAYYQLYDKLKGEWLEDLGVSSHGMDYFYNRDEYRQLEQILACTAEEYLFWQLGRNRSRADDLQKQVNQKKQQLDQKKQQLDKQKRQDRAEKKSLYDRLAARIDIKNYGDSGNGVEITGISDPGAYVEEPDWFSNERGRGLVVRSAADGISLRVRCRRAGYLRIVLRDQSVAGSGGEMIPVWIDYTSLVINGRSLLDGTLGVWHEKPFIYGFNVKDGETVEISLTWHSHDEKSLKLEEDRHNEIVVLKTEQEKMQDKLTDAQESLAAAVNSLEQAEGKAAQLEEKVSDLQRSNDILLASTTWKAGRAVTWLPRKIKDSRNARRQRREQD